jgi:hypothetical protein
MMEDKMITKSEEKNIKQKPEDTSNKEERIKLTKGKYSYIQTSSDEFANRKEIEIKNEERKK